MTTLTLRRSGLFQVRNVGEHWCGTNEVQEIHYSIEVVCATSLDERGFLFDQLTMAKFFDSLREAHESCEQFTIRVARELWKLIKRENNGCKVLSLRVTLSPAPYAASMTFEFVDDGGAK